MGGSEGSVALSLIAEDARGRRYTGLHGTSSSVLHCTSTRGVYGASRDENEGVQILDLCPPLKSGAFEPQQLIVNRTGMYAVLCGTGPQTSSRSEGVCSIH
ncbi:hypothetical protein CYMTET_10239 [Cymbomonas tetramitiformis]|uniref:Uncharacterized protein n=1 Tax=Cymbomonas tetramitiformis TaxID=36881 RepID=A0AAE0GQ52_9CHLO|nr:hypothetical protein CYMTET_10239 [Cymbomonas tetramitiformis]